MIVFLGLSPRYRFILHRPGLTWAPVPSREERMTWQVYAFFSAVAAGATAVLAKIGVEGVPSNLATAIRTVVILVFVSAIVAVRGEQRLVLAVSPRELLFLVLPG